MESKLSPRRASTGLVHYQRFYCLYNCARAGMAGIHGRRVPTRNPWLIQLGIYFFLPGQTCLWRFQSFFWCSLEQYHTYRRARARVRVRVRVRGLGTGARYGYSNRTLTLTLTCEQQVPSLSPTDDLHTSHT